MLRKAFGLLAEARAKGPREGIRHIGHRLYEAFHERRLGIRSAGVLSPAELGFGDPDLQEYTPVTYRTFRFIMARVAIDPLRDVFLDLGCGMGRAVVLAATRPFRQVVGVEIVPSLAQIARENVARAANRLVCNNIIINVCDATTYIIDEDVSIIFMNNPFRGAALMRVIANIRDSLRRRPRDLTIVFGNPGNFEAQVRDVAWLVKRAEFKRYPRVGYAIYESTIADSKGERSIGSGQSVRQAL